MCINFQSLCIIISKKLHVEITIFEKHDNIGEHKKECAGAEYNDLS